MLYSHSAFAEPHSNGGFEMEDTIGNAMTFWAIEQQVVCKQCAQERCCRSLYWLMERILRASFPRGVDEEGWCLAKFHHLIHAYGGRDCKIQGSSQKTHLPTGESTTRGIAKMPGH